MLKKYLNLIKCVFIFFSVFVFFNCVSVDENEGENIFEAFEGDFEPLDINAEILELGCNHLKFVNQKVSDVVFDVEQCIADREEVPVVETQDNRLVEDQYLQMYQTLAHLQDAFEKELNQYNDKKLENKEDFFDNSNGSLNDELLSDLGVLLLESKQSALVSLDDTKIRYGVVYYNYVKHYIYPLLVPLDNMLTLSFRPGEKILNIAGTYSDNDMTVEKGSFASSNAEYLRMFGKRVSTYKRMEIETSLGTYVFILAFVDKNKGMSWVQFERPITGTVFSQTTDNNLSLGEIINEALGNTSSHKTIKNPYLPYSLFKDAPVTNADNEFLQGYKLVVQGTDPLFFTQTPLNFNYKLKKRKKWAAPIWMPSRVFDDGKFTYIVIPNISRMTFSLSLLGYFSIRDSSKKLGGIPIRYKIDGDILVVFGLFRRIRLMAGANKESMLFADRLTDAEMLGSRIERKFQFD